MSVGFSLALAGVAAAGGRDRSSDGPEKVSSRGTGPEGLSGSLQSGTPSGDNQVWRDDGSVTLADMQATETSIRMSFDQAQAGIGTFQLEDGTTVYDDGTVGFFNDLLGPELAAGFKAHQPATVADVTERMPWMEIAVEGHSMMVVADGVVLHDPAFQSSLPVWLEHRQAVPHLVVDGERVYADGAVFQDEPKP